MVDGAHNVCAPDVAVAPASVARLPNRSRVRSARALLVEPGARDDGTAGAVGAAIDRIGDDPRACIIDFFAVSLLDSTGAATIDGFVRNAERRGAKVYVVGAARAVRRTLLVHGIRPPRIRFRQALGDAVELARAGSAKRPGT